MDDIARFIAEIEADISDFERDIHKAMAMAENLPDDVEVEVHATINDFKRKITQAEAQAKMFDGMEVDAEINADISDLMKDVGIAKTIINDLDNTRVDAEVDAHVKRAMTNITALQSMLSGIERGDYNVDINADTASALSRIRILETNLKSIENKNVSAEINADVSAAMTKIAMVKAQLNSFARDKTTIEVETKFDTNPIRNGLASITSALGNFQNKMDTLANNIRTTGTVAANVFKGMFLSSITALVPAIASVVPALMAVMNAIGVVGGGALGLANAFAITGAGVVGFGAMAMSALKMVENGTLSVTKEVQNYQSAVDDLKSAWTGVVSQNQSAIFNTLANGVNTAKVALQGLTPFLSGVAQGMEQASSKTLNWAKTSQVASNFFDMMGTTGVKVFNNMLSDAGSFGSGLIAVITNLAPLTEWVSQGFAKMGESFNKWANSVEGSQAIQDFTNYVKTNLPLIGEIFGSTFKGIFNLMKAFTPNSQLIFQSLAEMANRFEAWSAKIAASDGFKQFIDYIQTNGPKVLSVLGNIVNIIINVATAMAPLGAAVLSVVDAFTAWLANLTQAHPVIGALLGVISILAGAFMALYPAIQFVTTVIAPLIGQFVAFIARSVAVRAVMTALTAAFSALSAPVLGVIAVVAALIAVFVGLWNSSEQVRLL